MRIKIGKLKSLIKEIYNDYDVYEEEGIGLGNHPDDIDLTYQDVQKRFPNAWKQFLEKMGRDGVTPEKVETLGGTFILGPPPLDARHISHRVNNRLILAYLDDAVAWAWDGPSLGWDSVD